MTKPIYILLLACVSILTAQEFEISIKNIGTKKVLLHSLQGEKTFFIDSLRAYGPDKFRYHFDSVKHHNGIYRISADGKLADFVFDGGEIVLQTNFENISDSIKALKSESNSIFYEFKRLNRNYKTKSELLQLLLIRYPKEDDFYRSIESKLTALQSEYTEGISFFIKRKPGSFISDYIRGSQLTVVNFYLPPGEQLKYLKSHALDNVDFSDTRMINSDLFTNKSIEYLTYYSNPQLPKELLEKEFMTAADSLLARAKADQLVYRHITEYLIEGFKRFGMEMTLDYILNNYVIKDDICLDEKTGSSIQNRIEQNKKLRPNTIAPEISLNDMSGKKFILSGQKSKNTLILFYSNRCVHCKELIPQLGRIYKDLKNEKFEVVAVSLDEKKEDWLEFLKNNDPGWINVSDFKGWDSKAALDYFIYAIPTMFLLDENLRIKGRPNNLGELRQLLK